MPERLTVDGLLALSEQLAVEAESRVRRARSEERTHPDWATQLRVDGEAIAGVSRAFAALAHARIVHVAWLDQHDPGVIGREPAPAQEGAEAHAGRFAT